MHAREAVKFVRRIFFIEGENAQNGTQPANILTRF
jgi:hypothetical protein